MVHRTLASKESLLPKLQLLWLLYNSIGRGLASTSGNVWVYSLVGTDYDGYKMLPYFHKHYSEMGVPLENFHFDVLHDPVEPDDGLKASHFLGLC